ncbi:hypothetical protein [Noviherbaspirillum pedocola]|uniref:Uncharacterized protein n=1 Tax=Noviherbaspirillum pedocola TaxID=2801341 RepID=A0A934SYE6_9BURK|nr:hypothetical protein [Noviherbaspirillum pedocola]MBK4737316.1 hypothetical protein [Noviherbaspirillum pedocola]
MANVLTACGAILFWGALISLWVLNGRLFRELRENHPVIWEEMGAPESVFTRNGAYWRLEKFCLSGDYLLLDSARVTQLCNRLFVCKGILLAGLFYAMYAGRHHV